MKNVDLVALEVLKLAKYISENKDKTIQLELVVEILEKLKKIELQGEHERAQ